MAKRTSKTKIEKSPTLSTESIRRRFEERFVTLLGAEAHEHDWVLRRHPTGEYVTPTVQERWQGFLLAYGKGPNALPMQEASPFVTRITRDMRAVALERRSQSSDDELANLLDTWANDIEARPDEIYEDVYGHLVDIIDPFVGDGPDSLPSSVVESVTLLLEHFDLTRSTRDVTPESTTPALQKRATKRPRLAAN